MENVVWVPDHVWTSQEGRGTSDGQSPSGQCSENQRKTSSKRPTVISAPDSSAPSFFPSLKARDETVDSGTFSISPYRRATESNASMADIYALSVDLPVLSTVNLPGARARDSGHSTGMDLTTLLTNIDRHLRVSGATDNAISNKAGKADAIRNLRRYASGEIKGMWTLDTLEAVAGALGTSSWELLRPPGAVPEDESLRKYIDAVVDEKLARDALPQPKRKKR